MYKDSVILIFLHGYVTYLPTYRVLVPAVGTGCTVQNIVTLLLPIVYAGPFCDVSEHPFLLRGHPALEQTIWRTEARHVGSSEYRYPPIFDKLNPPPLLLICQLTS